MKDDESLSDKIVKEEWVDNGDHHLYNDFIYAKDVKEAVKKLKESRHCSCGCCGRNNWWIDKIFGKKLT